jgi:hypothetical protein
MIKTLSTVAILTAVLASPVFAQDEATPHKTVHALRHYRGTYNQATEPSIVNPRAPYTGSSYDPSFDRSRIGDHDPNFNPPS